VNQGFYFSFGKALLGYESNAAKALKNVGRKNFFLETDDAAVFIKEIASAKGNAGYDAARDQSVADMLKAGIVDPVKVTRSGLEHAVSAAAMLLTTEVAISEIPEEKKAPAGGADGMGGMDY
jgi:chaperonin GroEL (HSP60 family)